MKTYVGDGHLVELVGGSGLGISVGAPVGAPEGAEREATYNLSSCLNSPREVGSLGGGGISDGAPAGVPEGAGDDATCNLNRCMKSIKTPFSSITYTWWLRQAWNKYRRSLQSTSSSELLAPTMHICSMTKKGSKKEKEV